MKNNIVIKGMSVVSPLGTSLKEVQKNLCDEETSISNSKHYSNDTVFTKYSKITNKPIIGSYFERSGNTYADEEEFRRAIIDEAFKNLLLDSKYDDSAIKQADLIVGTSVCGDDALSRKALFPEDNVAINTHDAMGSTYANYIAKKHNMTGRAITVSTACSSSANALSYAFDLINSGRSDQVVVAGIDFLSYLTYLGFESLNTIDEEGTVPFNKEHNGINIGECVCFVLLEKQSECASDEIRVVAKSELIDSYGMTSPNPDGHVEASGMKEVIREAGLLETEAFGYVNAHGTGTKANDEMETKAIASALSGLNYFVSSTKSYHGHTLGAAGLFEIIISALVLKSNFVPPTLKLTPERKHYLARGKHVKLRWAISNSYAFGGNAVSVLLQRGEHND